MTVSLDMNSRKVLNLGDPSGATDVGNEKYVDTIANNTVSGSETFQGDTNMNTNCIKNLLTPTSNNDAVNKSICETTIEEKR